MKNLAQHELGDILHNIIIHGQTNFFTYFFVSVKLQSLKNDLKRQLMILNLKSTYIYI